MFHPKQFSQTVHEELTARQQKPYGVSTSRPSLVRIVSQEEEKAKKARLAQERRAKIMAQISALQKAFIKKNADLLASMETDEYVHHLCSFKLNAVHLSTDAVNVSTVSLVWFWC